MSITVTTSTAVIAVTSPRSATITTSGAAEARIDIFQQTYANNLVGVEYISEPAWVQFNTEAVPNITTGRLGWNAEFETLDLGVNSGAVLQLGQEFHILVQNDSGEELPNGTPVMVEVDQNGKIRTVGLGIMRVVKAVADGSLPAKLMLGITTVPIPDGERGMITVNGYINNLDTTAYELGDILWLNPTTPGTFTTIQPTAPALKLPVAVVTRVQQNTGSIYVRFVNGFDLAEIHDVLINNPQDGDVLKYNAALGVWQNGQP